MPSLKQSLHRFRFRNTAGTPGGSSKGNRAEFYVDGEIIFDHVLRDIRRAQRYVWLETYIFEKDEVGKQFMDALTEAAGRGCDVRLLIDRFGSPDIGTAQTKALEEAGGTVAVYNPLIRNRFGRKVSSFLHRDHRKILIADDIGYVGGRNIGLDYVSNDAPDRFFDLTARLHGPAVRDLASVFADSFRDATGAALPLPHPSPPHDDGLTIDVLELNNRKSHRDLDLALRTALRAARSSILLSTPYFVPPRWFMREIVAAAERGVNVHLLTAGRSDVPFIRVAGRHLYGRLLRRGIRVFEMQHPTLHAKCIVVDGVYTIVGSYNIDSYGAAYNLELGVALHGDKPAEAVADIFAHAVEKCVEVHLQEWLSRGPLTRFTQWAAFRIAKVG